MCGRFTLTTNLGAIATRFGVSWRIQYRDYRLDKVREKDYSAKIEAACLQVVSLISGLPPATRTRRMLLVLQVFVDESITSNHLVLAGYLTNVERWLDFTGDWQTVLNQKPLIKYFKFREATKFSDEFSRYSTEQRDNKVRSLIAVIKKHVLAATVCSVSLTDYKQILKGKILPSRLDNPYCLSFYALIISVMRLMKRHRLEDKVDFIFDENKIFAPRAMATYWHFRKVLTDRELSMLGSPPIFRDDVSFLPLQAADMVAGYVNKRAFRGPYPPIFDELRSVPVVFDPWREKRMKAFLEAETEALGQIKSKPDRDRERILEVSKSVSAKYVRRLSQFTRYPEIGELV